MKMTKMTKEEFLERLMTRREAEEYVGLSNVAFQHHLRTGKIEPCKEYGHGRGKVQLFWRDDLDFLIKFLKGENEMRIWKRNGYIVREVEFDHNLHEFEVVKDGEVIATITPADLDDMNRIISDLDAGEGVDGWEDGMGNVISIPEE